LCSLAQPEVHLIRLDHPVTRDENADFLYDFRSVDDGRLFWMLVLA
jgi:hypothetical protein